MSELRYEAEFKDEETGYKFTVVAEPQLDGWLIVNAYKVLGYEYNQYEPGQEGVPYYQPWKEYDMGNTTVDTDEALAFVWMTVNKSGCCDYGFPLDNDGFHVCDPEEFLVLGKILHDICAWGRALVKEANELA